MLEKKVTLETKNIFGFIDDLANQYKYKQQKTRSCYEVLLNFVFDNFHKHIEQCSSKQSSISFAKYTKEVGSVF